MALEAGRGIPDGYGFMRSSSADRERGIDVLKAAFAEGRLTRDEFEERSGQLYRSQTYAELAALTADLPVGPLGAAGLAQVPYPQVPYPQVPYPRSQLPYPARAPRRGPVPALAIAALVCAVIPGFPAAAGIIAGVVARKQIRETGARGEGIATAAIMIGALVLVGFLLYMVAGLVSFR
jgi:Domain of unknown function (DUF1707)/Domain of unknown function (DUF4190)